MKMRVLRFLDLSTRHFGLSDGISSGYAEAASVCLNRHHTPPATFELRDNVEDEAVEAHWVSPDDRTRRAWANADDATEAAAYAIALAALEVMRGLVAVSRAETRTGSDYYLGQRNTTLEDLEVSFRLEVSGTDAGGSSVINSRLRQKLEQARKGKSNLPAIASVVGFAALRVVSADVQPP
jgi:hypothetical protein